MTRATAVLALVVYVHALAVDEQTRLRAAVASLRPPVAP